ncbi:MAG: hypothetical protein ACYC77_04545 [Coriobacteriia bacterium]
MTARMRIGIIAGCVGLLLFASLSSAAGGTSGTVTVTARVNALASVSEIDDDTIVVSANTAWRLSCETPEGPVEFAGGKTSGTTIELPDETLAYSVAVD